MGRQIKQNEKGEFCITSTISDGRLHHKEWISENEAKAILIEDIVWDTYSKIIQIDRCFPNSGYCINGVRKFNKEISDTYFKEMESINTKSGWNLIIDKIREIKAKLNLGVLDIIRYNEEETKSSYQKTIDRLRNTCSQYWNLNIMRKMQIAAWNRFFYKLLREKRITKDELKKYAIPKEEMMKKGILNKSKNKV